MEEQSAGVRDSAKQAEEAQRWSWVEPSVWTARMLAALENGVKGGKWFSLIDKVYSRKNLEAAFGKVKRNKGAAGADHVTVERFESNLDTELDRLQEALKTGQYTPQAVKRVYIPKPGKNKQRALGIPTVRDRVVQAAVRQAIEPIFEKEFKPLSYGFRPQRGCKDALRKVTELITEDYRYVVEADIERYFDTIEHPRLMELIEERIADSRVLEVIERFLKAGILDGLRQWTPEEGVPQGGVISPLLANVYLHPLDCCMKEAGHQMVRYADDLVILCRSQEEAEQALERLHQWMRGAGLKLHPDKTRIVDMHVAGARFEFLGYSFEHSARNGRLRKWPKRRSVHRLRMKLRLHTRRTNGHSLAMIIERVNRTLRGWFEYYKHSGSNAFPDVGSWVRMRLRSILRKRTKRRGRGHGTDHQRWPNAFFVKAGLFSCVVARAQFC